MSPAIPSHRRLKVVGLYFEGLSYDEIARKAGIAKGSVAAIVEELKDGKFPQFEQLTEHLNELREMVVAFKKSKISPGEAIFLFSIVKKLIPLGVEPAQLESWVKMCRAVPEGEFSRSQIIQAASKLAKLEQEGLSYEQTLENLRASSVEQRKLDGELVELRAEETKLHVRKDELAQANHRLEAESVRLQGRLNAMAVKEKEEEDCLQELGEQVKQCQQEVPQLETEKSKLEEETSQLQERVLALEKQVNDKTEILKSLDGTGFPRDQLNRLRDRLSEIAQRHGTGEVVNKFFGYFKTYEALVDMEVTKEKLAEGVRTLRQEKESLARLGQKLGLTSEELAEGIAALKAVSRKGVSPAVVISYQQALTEAGIDPQSFQQLIAEFGGLEQVLAARRGELKGLAEALETKARALEELKTEEAKIKESISTLKNAAVKHIQGTVHSATSEVEKLCQRLRVDITKWGEVRAEMGKFEDELKFTRYFVKLPLSEEAISSLVADLSLQVVVQYLMIGLAWCRRNLNPKLRPPREITKKYYNIGEYTEVELADVLIWALLMLIGEVGGDKG